MQHGLTEPTMEDLIMCTCTIYTSELMGDYFSSYWNCLYTQTLKSTKQIIYILKKEFKGL